MSETKCQVFPSGTSSWHVWEAGAKEGDPCQCGQLPYTECHVPKESGKYDGTTMREVLEWASDVESIERHCGGVGYFIHFRGESVTDKWLFLGVTLYDALYEAWKARGDK